MAKFAFLLPRTDMVEPAGRIARELGLEVVLNRAIHTEQIGEAVEDCRRAGAAIIVARGRQASIVKTTTDFPVVEIQLTGQEVALLLRRAKDLVPKLERPKVGVVTIPNMVGEIQQFGTAFDIDLHTYFVSEGSEMEDAVEQAVADDMDVILGGDLVNACCRRLGRRTLFFEGTEDSIRTALHTARSVGFASDTERRNTAHLQALLDYSFNGIIELDAEGTILRINDVACKVLGRTREDLTGVRLETLLSQDDREIWLDALYQHRELYFSVMEVAGITVVANAAPVETGGDDGGVVFSFYEMHRMETQGARALRERYRLHRYLAYSQFKDVHHDSRTMQQVVKLARTFAEGEQLDLPPLRTRPDDLSRAIDMCLDDCVVKFNRYVVLTREARRLLMEYPWPGNYIQLRSFLERMVLTAPARTVNDGYVRGLLEELYPAPAAQTGEQDAPVDPEVARLTEALSRNGGNRTAAAAELGISKTTLWRRMKQCGIRDRYES